MSKHRFDPDKMHLLDMPERRQLMPPEDALRLLPIGNDDTILDLGAGTGYYAIPAARITKGTVYALDPERKMLEVLQARARGAGVTNIELLEGTAEEIPLSDHSVHGVIASLVLHEVDPLAKGLQEVSRVLKDGGYLFCLDWERKESPLGPPLAERIHSAEMEKALAEAGLTVTKRVSPVDFLYMFIAYKRGAGTDKTT